MAIIFQQKACIEEFNKLAILNKRPQFALYEGRLFIYRKDCDSFVEKIQQFTRQIFCFITNLFSKKFSCNPIEIELCINAVESSYVQDCISVSRTVQNAEISQLQVQLEKLQKGVSDLNELKAERDRLVLEISGLTEENKKIDEQYKKALALVSQVEDLKRDEQILRGASEKVREDLKASRKQLEEISSQIEEAKKLHSEQEITKLNKKVAGLGSALSSANSQFHRYRNLYHAESSKKSTCQKCSRPMC